MEPNQNYKVISLRVEFKHKLKVVLKDRGHKYNLPA